MNIVERDNRRAGWPRKRRLGLRAQRDAPDLNLIAEGRPGDVGIEQHRAGPKTNREAFSGYLPEDEVVALVERAGFVLEARSEINANPKDTADHAAGVWTLPPSLRLGERDREKYVAIGESDRMTLRFRKPAAPQS